jgi:hypothetical protein
MAVMHFSYPICCTTPGCFRLACYKIAARWSDGITSELKTYGLTCEGCLPGVFARSLAKQHQCRTAQGETLEAPGVYRLTHGRRDVQLERLAELEQQLLSGATGTSA